MFILLVKQVPLPTKKPKLEHQEPAAEGQGQISEVIAKETKKPEQQKDADKEKKAEKKAADQGNYSIF